MTDALGGFPEGARLLYLFAPAGIEELIRLIGVPAASLTPPPDVVPTEDAVEIVARSAARFS